MNRGCENTPGFVLDFDMDPKTAVDRPNYHGPSYEISGDDQARLELEKEIFRDGELSDAVLNGLRSRGQAVRVIDGTPPMRGTWIGIRIDPETHERTGGAPSGVRAYVEGD